MWMFEGDDLDKQVGARERERGWRNAVCFEEIDETEEREDTKLEEQAEGGDVEQRE
ncbi:unnamed protein product, partial [Ilex paraguariensis]